MNIFPTGFLFKPKENKETKEDADADLYEPAFLHGSSSIGIKRDPKEEDPKYKDIIEQASIEAEKIITQRNPDMVIGKCIMVWAEQTKILKEKHNIDWNSPAKLNKDARFD